MLNFLKRDSRNPWLEKDRQDQRRVIVTAVIFAVAILGGLAWLAHAVVSS